jgi:hypothetical protein
MTLPPGFGASWLDPLRGLPARPRSDPAADLPQRLSAANEVECELLELGGALVSLRRRGYAWVTIARAAGLPLAEVRALARGYARRVAVEPMRETLPAAETDATLVDSPAADARLHDRRPQLPGAQAAAVATARLPTDENILAAPFGDQPL